jgi:molecular chaperone DnaK
LADAILLDVLSVPIGVVFPGGRTDVVFPSNASLPVTRNVRIDRPTTDRDLPVGLWQGPDVTSPERQVLGVIRVPAALFQHGTDFQLEFRLTETLDLQVAFQSSVQKKPLLLEQQARRG